MSSSRSIAAARSRRAGESAPPVSGGRPVTSIGSHAAFAPQNPYSQQQQQYGGNVKSNVRTAKQPPQQQQKQMQQQQQQGSNNLPFSKLSVSDAIGLITLRLGKVEQFIIDIETGEHPLKSDGDSIPENSKIIDNSVLTTMISRLDALEKKGDAGGSAVNNEQILKISEDLAGTNQLVSKFNDELIKHQLAMAKYSEQMLRFERDNVETKDLLKGLMMRFDMFAKDTTDRFSDYEFAIAELEKNVLPQSDDVNGSSAEVGDADVDADADLEDDKKETGLNDVDTTIMTVDLKNMIKQELSISP